MTNKKATHNGTCQVCGRLQAVRPYGLAHHGYTTSFGYFQGTCRGSRENPVETHIDLLTSTVAKVRAAAERLSPYTTAEAVSAKGNIETTYRPTTWATRVEHVSFESEATFLRRMNAEPELAKHLRRSAHCYGTFSELWLALAEQVASKNRHRVGGMVDYVKSLEMTKAERHGEPLIPRGNA